jgi:hypothetical protein
MGDLHRHRCHRRVRRPGSLMAREIGRDEAIVRIADGPASSMHKDRGSSSWSTSPVRSEVGSMPRKRHWQRAPLRARVGRLDRGRSHGNTVTKPAACGPVAVTFNTTDVASPGTPPRPATVTANVEPAPTTPPTKTDHPPSKTPAAYPTTEPAHPTAHNLMAALQRLPVQTWLPRPEGRRRRRAQGQRHAAIAATYRSLERETSFS